MTPENRSQATPSPLMSLAEAADQFGISVKTLRRRISDDTIHGYRVSRLIRVDMDELRVRLMVEMPTIREAM